MLDISNNDWIDELDDAREMVFPKCNKCGVTNYNLCDKREHDCARALAEQEAAHLEDCAHDCRADGIGD